MTEIMPVPRNLNFTVLPAGSLTTPFFCRHVIIIRTPHKEVKSIPNYGNYYICNRLLLLKEYLQANAEPKYSIKCRA